MGFRRTIGGWFRYLAAIATPDASFLAVAAKADGHLYVKSPAGIEQRLDLSALLAGKGYLLGATADNAPAGLAPGADNKVLVARAGAAGGVEYRYMGQPSGSPTLATAPGSLPAGISWFFATSSDVPAPSRGTAFSLAAVCTVKADAGDSNTVQFAYVVDDAERTVVDTWVRFGDPFTFQWRAWRRVGEHGAGVPVRAATTINIPLSTLQTIDGVALATNDRVLVKNQSTPGQDGVYLAQPGPWTRVPEFSGSDGWPVGVTVLVTGGGQAGTQWYRGGNPRTAETTGGAWTQVRGAPLVDADIPSTIARDAEALLHASAAAKGDTPVATAAGVVAFQAAGADGTIHVFDAASSGGRKAVVNDDVLTAYEQGTLTVKSGKSRLRMPFPGVVLGVAVSANTAPTGASAIVDVNKNGSTIFTTQANRPAIAAGSNSSSEAVPDASPAVFATGDYFTFDIDQIGSTVAGADLTVVFRYRKT